MHNSDNNYRNSDNYTPRPFALLDVNAEPGSPERIVASFDTLEEAQAEARWLGDRGVAVEVEEVAPPPDFEPDYAELEVRVLASLALEPAPGIVIPMIEDPRVERGHFELRAPRIEAGPVPGPILVGIDYGVEDGDHPVLMVHRERRPRIIIDEISSSKAGRRVHELLARHFTIDPPLFVHSPAPTDVVDRIRSQFIELTAGREDFRTVPLPTREEAEAAVLVRDGYKSTSNKYRTVARLPEGKTGLEALRENAPEAYADLMAQTERQAANLYRRMHAKAEDKLELTVDGFKAFRSAGGESSF